MQRCSQLVDAPVVADGRAFDVPVRRVLHPAGEAERIGLLGGPPAEVDALDFAAHL
jgi:hypothetical protein